MPPPPPTNPVLPRAAGTDDPTVPTHVSYLLLLRGERFRWWRPLLSLAVLAAAYAVSIGVVSLAAPLLFTAFGVDPAAGARQGGEGIAQFVTGNLTLITWIPAVFLATWVAHSVRPGFVSSVVGRLRWAWLARCLLVVVPLWLGFMVATHLISPPSSPRPAEWPVLVALILLLVPLQAAAEEYVFRGWLLQNLSAYFRRPLPALWVGSLVSAFTFTVVHGRFDTWAFLTIVVVAVCGCYLTYRTGGLEAIIAIHVVNNVSILLGRALIGGWADDVSRSSPLQFALWVALQAAGIAAIVWQARRAQPTRTGPAQPSPRRLSADVGG